MLLLINTITAWDEPPRARHQITQELIRLGYRIVFIEKNRLGFPKIGFGENNDMLILSPYFIVGHKIRYRIPVLNELYQSWLYRKLCRIYGDQVIINFDFTAHRLRKYFSRIVYYCNDEQIGNSDYSNVLVDSYQRFCESSLIRQSKFCIATSKHLLNKIQRINPAVYEIPLGGPDPNEIVISRSRASSKEVQVVGLVGYISTRMISTKLINELLLMEEVSLVIVGPVEDGFLRNVSDPSKITFTGILKGIELYTAIQNFDVAIAPYAIESVNPGATSNKLFQYLACGVPVVISAIPNNKGKVFPEGTVYQVSDEDAFVSTVQNALANNNQNIAEVCKEVAKKNTWEIRIKQFVSILDEHIKICED